MSYIDSKNCSEHLMTNEMELDRAPVEFQNLVFLKPPTPARLAKIVFSTGHGLKGANF